MDFTRLFLHMMIIYGFNSLVSSIFTDLNRMFRKKCECSSGCGTRKSDVDGIIENADEIPLLSSNSGFMHYAGWGGTVFNWQSRV
jgi:hypothetical protein